MQRFHTLSVSAVVWMVASTGCGSDVSFSDRSGGGAGGHAGEPAGTSGSGGGGAGGTMGKAGANAGGTGGSSIMCVPGACADCACEAQACAMDAGCSEIHACALSNGCQSDFCVAERCVAELDDAEGEAADLAIAVTVCGAFHACGCVELGPSAPSCMGNRPNPVVDVRCDNGPGCSSRDLQFCCLEFGCFDVQSECPTTSVLCDGPEDCIPGQLCCGKADSAGTYATLECSYNSLGCDRMCHVGDDSTCRAYEVCIQSPTLPSGIGSCVVPL